MAIGRMQAMRGIGETVLLSAAITFATDLYAADSIRTVVYFRVNELAIDPAYMGNGGKLDQLEQFISSHDLPPEYTSVVISATSSPEGNPFRNKVLAERRAEEIGRFFRERFPAIDPVIGDTTVHGEAYDWGDIRPLIAADPHMPHRDSLLALIDAVDMPSATRNANIRALGHGETFARLKTHILDPSRTGTITITVRRPSVSPPVVATVAVAQTSRSSPPESVESDPQEYEPDKPSYRVAIKTNLLFDAVGAPNLALEFPVGRRFSLGVDGAYAFWRSRNTYAMQIIQFGGAAKYWFNPKRGALTGWSVGVYGMMSTRYDVQWGSGMQGDGFWSAGIGGGYALSVARNLHLEFAVAVGWIHSSEVRFYSRPDSEGRLIWSKTMYNVGRFSLTKLQLDLVWMVGKNEKRR